MPIMHHKDFSKLLSSPKKFVTEKRFKKIEDRCKSHGGKILFQGQLTKKDKIVLQCNKGHIWDALPSSITRDSLPSTWCPHPDCVSSRIIERRDGTGKRQERISEIEKACSELGLKWIDGTYHSLTEKNLKVKCANGHIHLRNADSLLRRVPCSDCKSQEKLNKLHKLAEAKGGKLVGCNQYQGMRSKYRWQCANEHQWTTTADSIQSGTWCEECSRKKAGSIKKFEEWHREIKRLIQEKNGVLLRVSNKSRRFVEVRCEHRHAKWETDIHNIRNGHWCPACMRPGTKEELCREIFQNITGHLFPKKRPKWLKNKNGNWLELDGYCEELGIAFEFNGAQHYEYIPYFHKTKEKFQERLEMDRTKQKLCKSKNIILLEIRDSIHINDLFNHVLKTLDALNLSIQLKEIPIDINSIPMGDQIRRNKELDIINKIAEDKGGECLSDVYVNNTTKLKFRCSLGHEWDAVPVTIKSGSWCSHKECLGERISQARRIDSKEAQKIIDGNGWKLSDKKIERSKKGPLYPVVLPCGHTNMFTLRDIKRKTKCKNTSCPSSFTYKKHRWKNKENCRKEALKYSTRTEFCRSSYGAYEASKNEGWINEFFPPETNGHITHGFNRGIVTTAEIIKFIKKHGHYPKHGEKKSHEEKLRQWLIKMRQAKKSGGKGSYIFYEKYEELATQAGLPYMFYPAGRKLSN